MNRGARLVIPGTVFGSTFLAVLLFFITAGVSYSPTPVQAAGSAAGPEEAPENLLLVDQTPAGPVLADSTASTSQNQCGVSPKFPEPVLRWCGWITHYSQKRGLPPDLVASVIWQESGGNAEAFSSSGAVGLMQVMPRDGIAASFTCINGPCFQDRPPIEKLRDPEFNISYGTKLLAGLVNKHAGYREALRAYGPMDVGFSYADTVLSIFQNYGS